MSSPFSRRFGATQGRVSSSSGFTPREGSFAFVFGEVEPGVFFSIGKNNKIEISQSADQPMVGPDLANTLRFRLFTRAPIVISGGAQWTFEGLVGSFVHFSYVLPVGGRSREMISCLISLFDWPGDPAALVFRLRYSGNAAEQELPLVVIDDLVFGVEVSTVTVANQVPVPGETAVARGLPISFDLVAVTASTDTSFARIFVGDLEVWDGSAPLAGWGVDFTPFTFINGPSQHVLVTPPADWDSLATVTVRVVYDTTTPPDPVTDVTWTFEIEDYTPPRLVSAVPQSAKRVRVTFNEPVTQVDPAGSGDALNPANYVIDRIEVAAEGVAPAPYTRIGEVVPSAGVSVLSVEAVSAREVDLILDLELSQAAPYVLHGGPIEDVFGNVLVAPYDTASFDGYVCSAPVGRLFKLWRMIPTLNRQEDTTGELQRFLAVIQDVVDLLLCKIDDFPLILDPDTAPEQYLDAMLFDLGNPFEFELSEIDKRRLVAVLVQIYQQKGTAIGVINVVRFFLGLEVTINVLNEEGWELGIDELGWDTYLGPGTSRLRYSFEVVSAIALTDEQRSRIRDIANYMKPAHTHLLRIVEPTIPDVPDDWEIGLSELGIGTILH